MRFFSHCPRTGPHAYVLVRPVTQGDDQMKQKKQQNPPASEQNPEKQEEEAGEVEGAQDLPLEEEYARVCAELEDQKQESLRILADAENLKKRLVREKEEFCKFATSGIIESILPVLDNLELALQHGQKEEACKNLVQGVEMTLSIFKDTLQKNGLAIIGRDHVGTPFDPAFHEAISQVPDPSMEAGCVSQVVQTGYKLHDRLIRPAKVVVSKHCDPEAD
jgi:molecular chaperone GrpE